MNANELKLIEKVRTEKERARLAAIEASKLNPETETDPWACWPEAAA